MLRICSAYEKLGQRLAERAGKNQLRKDYRSALRQEWFALLLALDQILAAPLHHSNAMTIRSIRKGWWNVGIVGADFDEAKERGKHMERRCSWRECSWHTEEMPGPSKACKGCGETVSGFRVYIALC